MTLSLLPCGPAGQREFVPLLLGAYQLLPPSKTPRRELLELAVIEEIEMGLHPQAISAAMLLVLDLLQRGYRVYLSTHSPHVLDVIWALHRFRESQAGEKFVPFFSTCHQRLRQGDWPRQRWIPRKS